MKTLLHIVVILLVAAIVAGGVYALVENTTLVSSGGAERGQPTVITSADGQPSQHWNVPEALRSTAHRSHVDHPKSWSHSASWERSQSLCCSCKKGPVCFET